MHGGITTLAGSGSEPSPATLVAGHCVDPLWSEGPGALACAVNGFLVSQHGSSTTPLTVVAVATAVAVALPDPAD